MIGVVAYICVVLGLANLYKRLTTRRVPICPHCGVATRPDLPHLPILRTCEGLMA